MATLNGSKELMRKLEEIAKRMGGGEVAIGFMEGSKYPDGTSVPSVAYWNEFGTSKIPARPFFRTMIANESPTWAEKMGKLAKEMDYDGELVLALMGEDIGGALIQSITDLNDPPLAPSTVKARIGKSKKGKYNEDTVGKPLIDTAHMINSIFYKVNEQENVHVELNKKTI